MFTKQTTDLSLDPKRRWDHVAAAFLAAILIPSLLLHAAAALISSDYHVATSPEVVIIIVASALVSAAAVYRHKRISLWTAAWVGVFTVLMALLSIAVAPTVWFVLHYPR